MLLVFDVGNTNIVIGVYQGDDLKNNWRISTQRQATADEYGMLIKNLLEHNGYNMIDITGVAISSVVPPLNNALEGTAKKYFNIEPLIIPSENVKIGLDLKYENPKEIGADRIVNAIAAYELYGGPVIVVDFGTATTFCGISAKGEYLGGAIAPGIGISIEALFQRAAKLPRIEVKKPNNVIGKTTIEGMQSGILYGYAGQVDYVVKRFKKELGSDNIEVIATGGLADLISAESETITIVNPLLTLEGLNIIYKLNRKQ
jgi:type III pantothenate kinase